MSKTWYGHHIDTIKGEDYVLFKDYLELDEEIEKQNYIIDKQDRDIVILSKGNKKLYNIITEIKKITDEYNEWYEYGDEEFKDLMKIKKIIELKEDDTDE